MGSEFKGQQVELNLVRTRRDSGKMAEEALGREMASFRCGPPVVVEECTFIPYTSPMRDLRGQERCPLPFGPLLTC